MPSVQQVLRASAESDMRIVDMMNNSTNEEKATIKEEAQALIKEQQNEISSALVALDEAWAAAEKAEVCSRDGRTAALWQSTLVI